MGPLAIELNEFDADIIAILLFIEKELTNAAHVLETF